MKDEVRDKNEVENKRKLDSIVFELENKKEHRNFYSQGMLIWPNFTDYFNKVVKETKGN